MPTPTLGEIDEMTLAQLRKLALTLFEPDDVKGLKKDQLKEAILDHLSKKGSIEEPEEEEDDELEVEDEEDDELPEEDDDELPEEDDEEDEEEEDEPPAKKKSAKAKSTPPEPNGDTLTAKQVATRIGTDAKTLRKFFRSPNSTVEPCGQGGRYEFAKTDLEKIRAEFEKWNTNKPKRAAKGTSKKVKAGRQAPAGVEVLEEDDELLELDDDEEPTPDVLDEIDDEIDEIDEELDVEDEEDDEEED